VTVAFAGAGYMVATRYKNVYWRLHGGYTDTFKEKAC